VSAASCIAALFDVRGNLAALEAVLAELANEPQDDAAEQLEARRRGA
jgi:hypothetical protein